MTTNEGLSFHTYGGKIPKRNSSRGCGERESNAPRVQMTVVVQGAQANSYVTQYSKVSIN